jgi:hypothetical protein
MEWISCELYEGDACIYLNKYVETKIWSRTSGRSVRLSWAGPPATAAGRSGVGWKKGCTGPSRGLEWYVPPGAFHQHGRRLTQAAKATRLGAGAFLYTLLWQAHLLIFPLSYIAQSSRIENLLPRHLPSEEWNVTKNSSWDPDDSGLYVTDEDKTILQNEPN